MQRGIQIFIALCIKRWVHASLSSEGRELRVGTGIVPRPTSFGFLWLWRARSGAWHDYASGEMVRRHAGAGKY